MMTEAAGQSIEALLEAAAQRQKSSPDGAKAKAEAALQIALAVGDKRSQAEALRIRAGAQGAMGDIAAAFADFTAAYDLSTALQDRSLVAFSLHGLGTVHQHRGEYALALEAFHRSVNLRRALLQESNEADDAKASHSNEYALANTLNNLGGVYGALGDFADAAICFTEALALAEHCQDRHSQQNLLTNIAILKTECGESEEALPYYERSIAISREWADRRTLANTLANYANTLRKLARYEAAFEAAAESVAVARELDHGFCLISGLLNLGHVQNEQGERVAALQSLEEALALTQTVPSPAQRVAVTHLLGEVHWASGDLPMALTRLQEALQQAQERQQKQDICDIQYSLYKLHAEMGDFAAALSCHVAYHAADRELQRQSAQSRLITQQAQRDVERARQEAEIHRLRTVELAELNQQKTELLEKLQSQTAELARLAIEDPLTGLYNRRYLTDFLEREIARSHRTGLPMTVAIADLDNFKQVNDRFSHRIGDEVLKATARIFMRHVRNTDVVARYGGEEFVVVLPETPIGEAGSVLERVRLAIAEYPWRAIHPELSVTVSVGLADEPLNSRSLLSQADANLYAAKLAGKNRITLQSGSASRLRFHRKERTIG
jgi:diguanylate cyclase (GGDEF)-like protein